MNERIEIKNLTQRYGRKTALNHIDLSIGNGMYGLLGRNGAGKTTLMKTMVGLLSPKEGSIDLCGISVKDVTRIRSIIGYLPQEFSLYPGMQVEEVLDYLGTLSEISVQKRRKQIPELLEKVHLYEKRCAKVKTLSGGMKRRLGLAQALLHEPKILVVDEPTVGLDPEERVRVRELLREESRTKTVVLSTHIVEDIETLCEQAAVLDEGRLVYAGSISKLLEKTYTKRIEDAYLKAIHSGEVY